MRKIMLALIIVMGMLMPAAGAFGEGVSYKSLTVLGDSIASGYGLSEYTSGNNYSAPLSFGNMLGAEF